MSTATLSLPGIPEITLPYNPNGVTWSYLLNKQVFDTYGGRVIQILSVRTDSMVLEGEAGTRARLLDIFQKLKQLQDQQIALQSAATLTIPLSMAESTGQYATDGSLKINVWFRVMNVGFDATTTTFPYQVSFEIEDHDYSLLHEKIIGQVTTGLTSNNKNFYVDAMGLSGQLTIDGFLA